MSPDSPSGPRSKRIVLVLAEDPIVQDLLSQVLTQHGFEVTTRGSADSGREVLASGRFDVAIVDLGLAGVGGRALCLEAKRSQPGLRWIVMTDEPRPDVSRLVKERQVDAVLCKPFDLSGLLSVIEEGDGDPVS